MKKEKLVTIRMDEKMVSQLKAIADKECRALSMQIRKVLQDYLKSFDKIEKTKDG